MNKFKVVVLIVLCPVLIVAGWLLYLVFGPKLAIESVLPADVVVYVRLAHPIDHLQKGSKSEFWKNISSMDVKSILAHNKVPASKIAQLEHLQKQIAEFINSPVAQRFLGKEIALAIYRHKNIDPLVDPQGAYGILLIARPYVSVQVAEVLSRFFKQWGEGITTRQEQIHGQTIVHVDLKAKHQSFKYTHLRDLFIIAQDKEPVFDGIINTYRRKNPSLNQDERFMFARSHAYPNAEGMLLINMQEFLDALKDAKEGAYKQISGFKLYSISFLPGTISKYKFVLGFDQKMLGHMWANLIACSPKENLSSSFVPAGVIAYQWSGCYDFNEMAQQIDGQLSALTQMSGQSKKIKKAIAKRLGFNLGETLLPLLGHEAGGYLTDIDTQGVFPYPRFLTFIKVTDQLKTQELLKKVFTPGLVQDEEYEHVPIRYFALPLGGNMDPGYCFLGDYLLIATSRQLLKKSIDTHSDPARSLDQDKTFKSFGLDASGKVQTVGYLKVGELAGRLRDLVGWGNKYLSAQVTRALTYQQEGQVKLKELDADLGSKEEELKLAQAKLIEWKAKPILDLIPDDLATVQSTIDHFQQQIQTLKEEIKTDQDQRQQIKELMVRYKNQAASAKSMMFNSEHLFMPILKSFELINAQGFKVVASPMAIEAELLVK